VSNAIVKVGRLQLSGTSPLAPLLALPYAEAAPVGSGQADGFFGSSLVAVK